MIWVGTFDCDFWNWFRVQRHSFCNASRECSNFIREPSKLSNFSWFPDVFLGHFHILISTPTLITLPIFATAENALQITPATSHCPCPQPISKWDNLRVMYKVPLINCGWQISGTKWKFLDGKTIYEWEIFQCQGKPGWWFFALPLWKMMELKSLGMMKFPIVLEK